jgi:two-component system LytT family response regulator
MIQVTIIDDESHSRELLATFLEKYCTQVEIVSEAGSVEEGLLEIERTKPNLIFLDIEMEGGTGFDLLDALADKELLVCFVTGYSEYAIKAIKYGAFDYLLKPLDIEELKVLIKKAEDRLLGPEKTKLIVNDGKKKHILLHDDIEYIAVSGNYAMIHLIQGTRIVSNSKLGEYEEILPETSFTRIHKSFIINHKYVKTIKSGRTGKVILNSDAELPIASRRKKAFLEKIERILE